MKPPRIPSVFKLDKYNRNKQFHYEPRTFDERKERLEKRRKEIEKEVEFKKRSGAKYDFEFRDRLTESWSRKESSRQQRNSSVRLLLILAALIVLVYLIYQNFGFLN